MAKVKERWDVENGIWVPSPVAEWRKAEGLTQEQLAERARVSPSLVAQVERGVILDPSTLWKGMNRAFLGMQAANGLKPSYERWIKLPSFKPEDEDAA